MSVLQTIISIIILSVITIIVVTWQLAKTHKNQDIGKQHMGKVVLDLTSYIYSFLR